MTNVAKYNITKGISTALTMGTPIVSTLCCADFFKQNAGTSISGLGILALLFVLLFTKDKLAENLKVPSAMVVAGIVFVLTTMVAQVAQAVQVISGATFIAASLDEITCKKLYKALEQRLPDISQTHKFFGFMWVKYDTLLKEQGEKENGTNS